MHIYYLTTLLLCLSFYRHTTDLLVDSMLLGPLYIYLLRARSQPRRGKGTTVFLMNP